MDNAFFFLLGLGAVIWFWLNTLHARESAIKHCTQACQRLELQFLDQTVALKRLGLQRNKQGRIQFKREYCFEFSNVGNDRYAGQVIVLGSQILHMQLDSPQPLSEYTQDSNE